MYLCVLEKKGKLIPLECFWDHQYKTSEIFYDFRPLDYSAFSYYCPLANFWPLPPKKYRCLKWMVPLLPILSPIIYSLDMNFFHNPFNHCRGSAKRFLFICNLLKWCAACARHSWEHGNLKWHLGAKRK